MGVIAWIRSRPQYVAEVSTCRFYPDRNWAVMQTRNFTHSTRDVGINWSRSLAQRFRAIGYSPLGEWEKINGYYQREFVFRRTNGHSNS